jgi:hypothetical protein
VHNTAATQQVLDELQFGGSWPDPEQVDVDREDLVEVLANEHPPDQVDIGQVDMLEDGLPRGDMVGVALGRAGDRDCGPVDGGNSPAGQLLADKRHRHAGAGPDLQDLVIGRDVQQLHRPLQTLGDARSDHGPRLAGRGEHRFPPGGRSCRRGAVGILISGTRSITDTSMG